ncbi:outer membrane family protein [Helicobacter sp. 12S02232-10]|uniref:outer membrane family protein n=1 Tax=Helicobacter sp. 12S02232-10 TaxID=1476197 RepID=UPI000BA5C8FF|nr:outer membrane family protein [Helicobacter sp. 12S02232-10]
MKFIILFILFISCSHAFSYKFYGSALSFSKLGFNHSKIDLQKGKFPTESYSFLDAGMRFDLDLDYGFNAGIGGYVGGVAFDGTKFVKTTEGDFLNPNGVIYNLFGFWTGSNATGVASSRTAKYYSLTEANIGYKYLNRIDLKLGRFKLGGDLGTDWLTSYVQGVGISSRIIPDTALWFFAINKRAFVGGSWFKDFKYINPNLPFDNGKGFYIYAGGVNIRHKNINLNAYIYAQDSRFIAPGFRFKYDTKPDFNSQGFRSKTELLGLFMTHFKPGMRKTTGFNNYAIGTTGLPDSYFQIGSNSSLPHIGKGGISLMFKQTFYINAYNFGFLVYKNFGNPNEFLGSIGDPTGYDNWNNSIYDSSTWNNMFRRDSLSGFLFLNNSFGKFSYGFLGRITHAPRANEQALSLSVNYLFFHNTNAGFILTYYNNTTFKGYTLGLPPQVVTLKNTLSQDRSFIQTYINYNF